MIDKFFAILMNPGLRALLANAILIACVVYGVNMDAFGGEWWTPCVVVAAATLAITALMCL